MQKHMESVAENIWKIIPPEPPPLPNILKNSKVYHESDVIIGLGLFTNYAIVL